MISSSARSAPEDRSAWRMAIRSRGETPSELSPLTISPSVAPVTSISAAFCSFAATCFCGTTTVSAFWGGKGFGGKGELKKSAVAEMKHAEAIAERLNYLGGIPTTKPAPIFVGNTLKEMIEQDKKDEEGAIALYKKIIEAARKEGDEVTNHLFREILSDEEEHHDVFSTLLEEI